MTWADFEVVAELATELGYATTASQVAQRFGRLQDNEQHGLFVAEETSGEIVGWMHVCQQSGLLDDGRAEVRALVVRSSHRRLGVGKSLMAAAEDWARDHGLSRVRLGSQTHRTEAHSFYEDLGYRNTKTSLVFVKELS